MDETFLLILVCIVYWFALNSTINAVFYAFLAPFINPAGVLLFIPLILYLSSNKVRTHVQERVRRHSNRRIHTFQLSNLLNIPKTIGYYICLTYLSILPNSRLAFFHTFKAKPYYTTLIYLILNTFLVVMYTLYKLSIDTYLVLWFVLSIGMFSNYVTLGQEISERYMCIPNVSVAISLVYTLHEYNTVYWIIVTLMFCRSYTYVPVFKDNVTLFSNNISKFPDEVRGYNNLASYYLDWNRYIDAIKPLLMAEKLSLGDKYGIYANLANCYANCGYFHNALQYTKLALTSAPEDKVKVLKDQQFRLEDIMRKVNRNRKNIKDLGIL